MTKKEQSERDEAIARLRETLKPGDTVYTSVEHVSRSGMSREIKVYAIQDSEPLWLAGYASRAIGCRLGKRDGLIVGGCGMDMGFWVVYNLGYALFPNGVPCTGDKCLSNDHVNYRGDRSKEPRGEGVIHHDGGYAFRHRWL
jgi:hypothetical protein